MGARTHTFCNISKFVAFTFHTQGAAPPGTFNYLQGDSGGCLPGFGLPALPVLPCSHLPEQNQANSGTSKSNATQPRQATTRVTLYFKLKGRLRLDAQGDGGGAESG